MTGAGPATELCGLGVSIGRRRILDGVDLRVEPGSWTAVIGPNGAGKSTLLRAVAGLLPHEGTVRVGGRRLAELSPRERAQLIGYAPQNPVLPDGVQVHEYVMLGRTPHHRLLAGPQPGDRRAAGEALERLDLADLAGRRLRTLSGGERQRAVLARALAQQAQLLLLDEPTAALDLGHAQLVLELVDSLRAELGLTVLSTLHDLTLAGQYADRLLLLAAGRPVAVGSPAEVLTSAALAEHYGARAEVSAGPDGVRIHPVRPGLSPARPGR